MTRPKAKYLREPLIIIALGLRVKELRKKSKMSQEELAHKAGVVVSQIGRIERGQLNVSVSTISAIAKALGVHPKDLFVPAENAVKLVRVKKNSHKKN